MPSGVILSYVDFPFPVQYRTPDAPVAQWIEQRFPKPRAARSIRVGGTTPSSLYAPKLALRRAIK